MTETPPVFISPEEVERLLDLTELLPAIEDALIEFSSGNVVQPVRQVLSVPDQRAWFGLMPCIYRDVMGAKLVTVFPGNADRQLHTHHATIQLFRLSTGEPLAGARHKSDGFAGSFFLW